MTQQEIEQAAHDIWRNLNEWQRDYLRTEYGTRKAAGEQRLYTPFAILHDLMDANELLPAGCIQWTPEGPDCTDANAIMDAFNALF